MCAWVCLGCCARHVRHVRHAVAGRPSRSLLRGHASPLRPRHTQAPMLGVRLNEGLAPSRELARPLTLCPSGRRFCTRRQPFSRSHVVQ